MNIDFSLKTIKISLLALLIGFVFTQELTKALIITLVIFLGMLFL